MRRFATFLTLMIVMGISGAGAQGEDTLVRAAVLRVLGPHIFTIEYQSSADGELVVVAPDAEATPVQGTTVLASGVVRRIDPARLKGLSVWNDIDDAERQFVAGRPVLMATSVRTAAGRQLIAPAAPGQAAARAPARQPPSAASPEPLRFRLHPSALAELIDELGGTPVTLPRARVLVVLNPRAFLIETASPLPAIVGNLDRLLVLVDGGGLRVQPALLVKTNVTVVGTARTLLGLQTTAEAPWPTELTPDILDRFEIRAAVLATSVQTGDGVELTSR